MRWRDWHANSQDEWLASLTYQNRSRAANPPYPIVISLLAQKASREQTRAALEATILVPSQGTVIASKPHLGQSHVATDFRGFNGFWAKSSLDQIITSRIQSFSRSVFELTSKFLTEKADFFQEI